MWAISKRDLFPEALTFSFQTALCRQYITHIRTQSAHNLEVNDLQLYSHQTVSFGAIIPLIE